MWCTVTQFATHTKHPIVRTVDCNLPQVGHSQCSRAPDAAAITTRVCAPSLPQVCLKNNISTYKHFDMFHTSSVKSMTRPVVIAWRFIRATLVVSGSQLVDTSTNVLSFYDRQKRGPLPAYNDRTHEQHNLFQINLFQFPVLIFRLLHFISDVCQILIKWFYHLIKIPKAFPIIESCHSQIVISWLESCVSFMWAVLNTRNFHWKYKWL